MSFVANAGNLRALAQFLEGLQELSYETGIMIDHYERIQVRLPDSVDKVNLTVIDGAYVIQERD